MKLELCSFSGYRIPAGKGKKYVRLDGRTFFFITAKAEAAFRMKRSQRKIAWTVFYRRKHGKAHEIEFSKRHTRKTTKFARAIGGADLAKILEKREQKPEVRKALREQALRAAKEKAKKEAAAKKAVKAKQGTKPVQQQHKAIKQTQKGRAMVGGKR